MRPANQESPLRWTQPAGRPAVQVTCVYGSGRRSRHIKRVKLAPGADIALVQDILPDDTHAVRFYDTSTWLELWNIPLPRREPCTSGREIGALFLSTNRYVIAHDEVLLAERKNVVWRMTPPVPTEWTIDPLRVFPNAREWTRVSNSDPTTDSGRLYMHVHWGKILGLPQFC